MAGRDAAFPPQIPRMTQAVRHRRRAVRSPEIRQRYRICPVPHSLVVVFTQRGLDRPQFQDLPTGFVP